jgi:hypothetical protein
LATSPVASVGHAHGVKRAKMQGHAMNDVSTSKKRRRSRVRTFAVVAITALCFLALSYAMFSWTVDVFFGRPLAAVGDWIGRIEVEGHGGDLDIIFPEIPPAK